MPPTPRTSRVLPKYQQVAFWVTRQVEDGNYRPGEKIPAIRELCEQFSVGDVTIKAALRYLSERGVVRTVVGSGAYVCEPSVPNITTNIKTVGLLKIGLRFASTYSFGIDLVQQHLQKQDFSTLYNVVDTDDVRQAEDALRRFRDQRVGKLIVFPSHRETFEESPSYPLFKAWDGKLLILESPAKTYDYVSTDIERSTYDITHYLYELGHRRICLATNFYRKVQGFRKALRQLDAPDLKHWIVGESGKTDQASHDLGDSILALNPRPTAVIAADDHAGAVLVRHIQHAGLRVPEDISVASFDDDPRESARSPVALTTIRHPGVEVAQEVARWAQQPADSTRPYRRDIRGSLIVRDSTSAPNSDQTPSADAST